MSFPSKQFLMKHLRKIFLPQTPASQSSLECKNVDISQKIKNILQDRKTHLNPMQQLSYGQNPLKVAYARNQYLYTQDGAKVLDCINNVSHIGHCNPFYTALLNNQTQRLQTNSRFLYDQLMKTTHRLLQKLPQQLCVVTFVNSGSQANDLAMQMAEVHSKKKGIICLEGAYHGVTRSCLQVSPYKWQENSNFIRDERVTVAKAPCTYRGILRDSLTPEEDYAAHIESLITPETGTFICQYMQSCGGQVVPPRNLYKAVYEKLRQNNVVTVGDEVQTGFARLGQHFWAFQYYGVVPDILTVGKAMGNGFPVAAVICKRQIADSFKNQGIGFFSTYGGSPMAMTATFAVLEVIKWLKLQENATVSGKHLNERLKNEILPYPYIGQIRGMGLFQGIDVVKSKESREEDGALAKKIIMRMRSKNVLISRDGVKGNVLKIKPPIIFDNSNVDTLIEKLKETFAELENQKA